jgi:Arc/MetJ-type ribon-helix-helix transcriptional regulator
MWLAPTRRQREVISMAYGRGRGQEICEEGKGIWDLVQPTGVGTNGIIIAEVHMVVSLRPELQKMVKEKVKAGLFPSAEALINAAVEQVVSEDDLEPGEMERLLAVGEADARAGRFVDGPKAFAKIKAKSKARRKRK